MRFFYFSLTARVQRKWIMRFDNGRKTLIFSTLPVGSDSFEHPSKQSVSVNMQFMCSTLKGVTGSVGPNPQPKF
jgi:hypothetical protein